METIIKKGFLILLCGPAILDTHVRQKQENVTLKEE